MSKTKPQDKKYHYVYKIIMKGSRRYYIGRHSTNNDDFLNDGYWGSGNWTRSIKDKTRLSKIILGVYNTYEELLVDEEKYILEHIEDPNCMNYMASSCGAAPGNKLSEETKKKLSVANKGKTRTEEQRKKISDTLTGKYVGVNSQNYGKPLSKEHRQKISNALKGKLKSKETIQKLSNSLRGKYTGENSYWYGRKHTEESRQKMSAVQRGKTVSEESRKKQSASMNGKTHSEEVKQKMSDAHKNRYKTKPHHMCGKTLPKETRQKISTSAKGKNAGEKCGSSKLKEPQVREILERYAIGGITQKELAAEYGVGVPNISNIINRRTWTHIQ